MSNTPAFWAGFLTASAIVLLAVTVMTDGAAAIAAGIMAGVIGVAAAFFSHDARV